MKHSTILYILAIPLLLTNCKKEDIELYSSGHYIQFTTPATDTVTLSFFFYAGKPDVDIALPVKLVGHMPEGNLNYQVKVDPEVTTALPKNYTVPASFTFRQGLATDSAVITVHNSAELTQQNYLLALEIVGSDGVIPGQTTHIRKVIRLNDMVSKPVWWDANMDRYYLGVYSEKKYRTFMDVVGVGALNLYPPAVQREFMLQFKYYLIDMKDAGTPVLEDDGTDMLSTIPLIG